MSALGRAFELGLQASKIVFKPHIPRLKGNNVRKGFFERGQFLEILKRLPEDVQPVISFAYITGWRINSEVLPLEWRQVDFQAGMVRLEPGTTKNDEGRVFFFTEDLRILLEAQRSKIDALQLKHGIVCPWVFHRQGERIEDFCGAWERACRQAGLPGRIPHDFRRPAVRNLGRAGVPRSVAMKLTGHKTEVVYRRYAIVAESDLAEGVAKLQKLAAAGVV